MHSRLLIATVTAVAVTFAACGSAESEPMTTQTPEPAGTSSSATTSAVTSTPAVPVAGGGGVPIAATAAAIGDVLMPGAQRLAGASERVGVATYTPAGIDRTQVGRVAYRDDATLDVYYPPDFRFDVTLPTVVLVSGFSATGESVFVRPDGQVERFGSFDFQNADNFISAANLIAASGMIAVVYGTADDPDAALDDAVEWLLANADELSVDTGNLAAWMFSIHTLVGLRAVMDTDRAWTSHLSRVVVFYGWMPLDELRPDLPVLVVKALEDDPLFIESLDAFMAMAASTEARIEYHEVQGPHAFDYDPACRDVSDPIIETALEFVRGG